MASMETAEALRFTVHRTDLGTATCPCATRAAFAEASDAIGYAKVHAAADGQRAEWSVYDDKAERRVCAIRGELMR